MAIDQGVYDALMFENVKINAETPLQEQARSTKAVNGILETALANNIMNMQRMDVTEAAAVSSVIRNDLSPQLAAMAGAIAALRDVVRTAEPSS